MPNHSLNALTQRSAPLLKILGCEYPIMLAGMGGVARHKLAAAVSNAGGFGVLGMVREPAALIRSEILALRELSQAPFAVNLIPACTNAALLKEQVDTCLDLDVSTFVLFWEVDTALIRYLKSLGKTVIHQVGYQCDADAAQAAGADVLIVQGQEAGGHVRGQTSTLSLLPQIIQHCDVPVVASGGIASGQAVAAAMMFGAQGVSLGTAFLATHEANAHLHHKQRVLAAEADETIYTTLFARNWHEAAPVRVLTNAATRGEYDSADRDLIIGHQDGQPVYIFSTDSPLVGATGKLDDMALYCGQSCSQISTLCSAAERFQQIAEDAAQRLNQLP